MARGAPPPYRDYPAERDAGAVPRALALEAQSAAHEVAERLVDERARQAGVNVDFRARFDAIDLKLMAVLVELGEMRGEARGATSQQKSAVVWLGLAVAAIELLSHLPWSRIVAGHV